MARQLSDREKRVAALIFSAAALILGGLPFDSAPGIAPALIGVKEAAAADSGAHDHSANEPKAAPAKKKGRSARDAPIGREGDPRKVSRVIKIEMSDAMRYFPDHISVKKGQTVRFVVGNGGQVQHELVIGTMDDLKKHAELMRKHGEQGPMVHDEPNAAHVEPGATGRIVWQFTRTGEFYYGCLVPGHFEAGMIGTIVVR
jgi:uncharacterized cupredoxin-like copper-binding protein